MTRGSELRWLRRQAPGTLGGRSEQATPAPSRPRPSTSPLEAAPGQRGVTVMVASDDADERTKDGADFVCDMDADEEQINAGADFIRSISGPWGAGILQLSGGRFKCGDGLVDPELDLSGMRSITFKGVGPTGTYVYGQNGRHVKLLLPDSDSYVIRDMELDGDIVCGASSYSWIERMIVDGAIYGDPDNPSFFSESFILNNWIWGVSPYGDYGIDFNEGNTYLKIGGNQMYGGGVRVTAQPGDFTIWTDIFDNLMESGEIFLGQSRYPSVRGNYCGGVHLLECGDDDRGGIVADNNTFDDIVIEDSMFVMVDANYVEGQEIILDNSPDCTVTNNFVNFGPTTPASIEVRAGSHRALVHGNKGGYVAVPVCPYFIEIAAGVNNAKVYGNDGFGAWATAAVHDLGTGTDLTSANR